VLVPQTLRLPQRLVEDLARAAIERKIKRRKPWSQQDIVAEAIKDSGLLRTLRIGCHEFPERRAHSVRMPSDKLLTLICR